MKHHPVLEQEPSGMRIVMDQPQSLEALSMTTAMLHLNKPLLHIFHMGILGLVEAPQVMVAQYQLIVAAAAAVAAVAVAEPHQAVRQKATFAMLSQTSQIVLPSTGFMILAVAAYTAIRYRIANVI
jgi:hypothetical protein